VLCVQLYHWSWYSNRDSNISAIKYQNLCVCVCVKVIAWQACELFWDRLWYAEAMTNWFCQFYLYFSDYIDPFCWLDWLPFDCIMQFFLFARGCTTNIIILIITFTLIELRQTARPTQCHIDTSVSQDSCTSRPRLPHRAAKLVLDQCWAAADSGPGQPT